MAALIDVWLHYPESSHSVRLLRLAILSGAGLRGVNCTLLKFIYFLALRYSTIVYHTLLHSILSMFLLIWL